MVLRETAGVFSSEKDFTNKKLKTFNNNYTAGKDWRYMLSSYRHPCLPEYYSAPRHVLGKMKFLMFCYFLRKSSALHSSN